MTVAAPPVTALVLSGGAARRMGGSKAELDLGGMSLLARTLRLADAVADEVLLLPGARPVPRPAAARKTVRDWPAQGPTASPGPTGPLAALGAGLDAARHSWCLLLPCDMPWLSLDVLARLMTRCANAREDIVAIRSAQGWEPFAALYRRPARERVRAELDAGRRSLQGLLERAPVHAVEADALRDLDPELLCLRNVNTPDELEAARAEARACPEMAR